MKALPGLDQCLTFVNCQLQPGGKMSYSDKDRPRRAVTISRQTGCGARVVAAKLADHLQSHDRHSRAPWTVFDQNLIERVLEDHHLPKRIEEFMPEDRISEIADIMDGLFELRPSSWTLVHHTSETILHLAELGSVILIGRGANIVTSKFDHIVHVRLIAPLEQRIERIQQTEKLSAKEAAAFIRKEDRGRHRYIKKYFEQDINDPLLYHLVINTGLVSLDKAVRMIAEMVLNVPANSFSTQGTRTS